MKEIVFIKKSQFGAKGEKRIVTERAAEMFAKLGLIEVKEEKQAPETKEEKVEIETKEEKPKRARITKSPKL